MNFRDIFNKTMSEKGITDEEVANYLKISIDDVEGYRIGLKEPSINNIIKLADYFDVTTDYLIGVINVNLKYKDREDLINKIKSKLDIFDESDLVELYKIILEIEGNGL